MWHDPIVDEIRQHRQQYAAQFDFDLKAICRDLRERQKRAGRRVVTLPPRPAKNKRKPAVEPVA